MGEHTSGERKPKKPTRLSGAVLPAVGLVAVLAGCVVAWSNSTTSVGWFAYAPLSNQLFTGSGTALVSQGMQIGVGVAVAGLLVLAFWAGYRIGRQTAPKKQ